MDVLDSSGSKGPLPPAHAFDIEGAKARLAAAIGGYEIVHLSDGLEIGVYVLVAPEPDEQQPHADDEVYVVLRGEGFSRSRASRWSCERGMRCSSPPGRSTGSPAMSSFQCSSSSSDGDHGRGTA